MNQSLERIAAAVEAGVASARALVEGRTGSRADGFWSDAERSRLAEAVTGTLRGELPETPPAGPRASRGDLALGEEAVGEFERVVSASLQVDYAGLPGARSRIGDVFERYVATCRG